MNQAHRLLETLFELLSRKDLEHCVMGDTRALPDLAASDIDIVLSESALPTLPQVLDELRREANASIVRATPLSSGWRFTLAWPQLRGRYEFLTINFHGDFCRGGRRFFTADELLEHARPAIDLRGKPRGFALCSPAHEFAYSLIRQVERQELPPRAVEHLTQQWRLDRDGASRLVERFWRRSEARILFRAADSGDWSAVVELLPKFRAALRRRIPLHAGVLLRSISNAWSRWARPQGLVVAMLGPDGSGKSGTILSVDRVVQEAFHQTTIVRLRPGFLYPAERTPFERSEREPPRGRAQSMARTLFFAADFFLGYWCVFRRQLTRSSAFLFDRYYDDLLVDPARYRYGGSLRVARLLRAFVPRPDLWILLDAPSQVLQSRRRVASAQELERQRQGYRELLLDQRRVVIIDGTQPPDRVIAAAAQAILESCAAKAERQMGLKTDRHTAATRWLKLSARRIPLLSAAIRALLHSHVDCALPRDVRFPLPYGLAIHRNTRLGRRVTVMQHVTIAGKSEHDAAAPTIGNDVFIGVGATILGPVTIGDGAVIGAHAVVTQDVPARRTVVAVNRLLPEVRDRGEKAPVVIDAVAHAHDALVAIPLKKPVSIRLGAPGA